MPKFRSNGEGAVIYASDVPTSSVGWDADKRPFFEQLGNPAFGIESPERQAEQVYLLSSMEKASLWEASRIALDCDIGIAVRPTGLLAHMGLESGNPTKSVEFKNKTSKLEDLFLCDWLTFAELGSVVHYDPRVGWTPETGTAAAQQMAIPVSWFTSLIRRVAPNPLLRPLSEPRDWLEKRRHILQVRIPQLHRQTRKDYSVIYAEIEHKIQSMFKKRVKEYLETDALYRPGGHYAQKVTLVGVHIRSQLRPDAIMVGDHDLFGFTEARRDTLLPVTDERVNWAQRDLQHANNFQAQHGGIWNWTPPPQHLHIKDVIMGAHGPDQNEPLVYFRPDGGQCVVMAAYYIKASVDRVESIWHRSGAMTAIKVANPLTPFNPQS